MGRSHHLWSLITPSPWGDFSHELTSVKCSANRKVLYKHNGASSLLIKISLICTQLSGELWGWRRLLRVPWAARRSNYSILKEISPQYSLEELMLKLQYFGHLMQRVSSLEKTWCGERLKAGSERDNRTWDGRMVSLTQWAWVWASSRRWQRTGKPGMLQSMGLQAVTHERVTE